MNISREMNVVSTEMPMDPILFEWLKYLLSGAITIIGIVVGVHYQSMRTQIKEAKDLITKQDETIAGFTVADALRSELAKVQTELLAEKAKEDGRNKLLHEELVKLKILMSEAITWFNNMQK